MLTAAGPRYPLSASQRLVFDHCLAHPQTTQYNLPAITRLAPAVDAPRLAAAWRELIAQRPVLRTRFALGADGVPQQWSDAALVIPVVERHLTEAELAEYLAHGFVRPFDILSGEPLLRVEFITTELGTVLLTDMQHSIFDGITFNRLIWGRDLVRLYEGKKISSAEQGLYEGAAAEQSLWETDAPADAAVTAADVAEAAERRRAYRQAREYILRQLQGVPVTTLSYSAPETTGPLVRWREYLPKAGCDALAAQLGGDANDLFLAAFTRVLARHTGQAQASLLLKHHGRLQRRQLQSYGMFVRFLPVVLAADLPLPAVRRAREAAAEHALYPLWRLQQECPHAPRLIYNFLALKHMDTCLHLAGAAMPTVLLEGGPTEDELSCNIYLRDTDYEIRVESGSGMNDAATVRQVAEEIRTAVREMGGV